MISKTKSNKWNYVEEFANYVISFDESREIPVKIVKEIADELMVEFIDLGVEYTIENLFSFIYLHFKLKNDLNSDDVKQLTELFQKALRWYWCPFSKVRRNLNHLIKISHAE